MLDDPVVKILLLNIVKDEENLKIIKCLSKGIETDEEIAEKTGIKLNIVRKILYRLYDYKLASYKRSKDPNTQWFTYSWKFEEDEITKYIKKSNEEQLEIFQKELEEEENNMFFICPEGHVRVNFNIASDYDFMCPECSEELLFHDNTDIIAELKEAIEICKENYDKFNEKNG